MTPDFVFVCLTLALYCSQCLGMFVSIDANAEECFFDRVSSGAKLAMTFEVSEGGFLDIDVQIQGPDGNVIYNGERESNGKYTFSAHADGVYKYCFSNKMSTMTPKVVMFSMIISDRSKPESDKDGEGHADDKLEIMINELSTSLTNVKQEQQYMEIRERVHRSINDNTNSRVVLWAFFEALCLVAMTLGQIYYLKRFFEVRRAV